MQYSLTLIFCTCTLPLQPKTIKDNTIIEHTASRIAANNQLEVFLKVKQATNADFAFLQPSDELHRYYQHLKEKYSSKLEGAKASRKNDSDGNSSEHDEPGGNSLSGLLGGYSSSSSDESSVKSNIKQSAKRDETKDTASADGDGDQPKEGDNQQSNEQNRKRKERLERLAKWKESRKAK